MKMGCGFSSKSEVITALFGESRGDNGSIYLVREKM